ncbi:MAG: hypothetical protein ACRESS_02995 [Stenotrophobium sp.]
MRSLRWLPVLLISAVTVLLSACSGGLGVGDGNRIVSTSVVNGANNGVIAPPFVAYQCLRQSVHLLATFLNGESGDYTSRAVWTSSNDSIVHVSNANKSILGDLVPSQSSQGLVYAAGTLIPGANPGFATITATYVGLTASVQVQVKTPASLFISKDQLLTPVPHLNMAPRSIQSLRLLSDLDGTGVPTDITSYALWSIPDDPNGTVVTVSQSGLLVSVGNNVSASTVNVQANFDGCPSIPTDISTALDSTVTVANIDHLVLSSEQDSNPQFTSLPGKLITGTTEALKLLAYFSPGPDANPPDPTHYQDLSYQSNFYTDYSVDCPNINLIPAPSTPSNVIELGFSLIPGFSNIVSALQSSSNPVKLSASFGAAPNAICAGNDVVRTVVDGTLDHLAIRGDERNLTIAPGATQQFNAIGTFVGANASLIGTQDITRSVIWSVDTPADLSISNVYTTAGLATSNAGVSGCVNIVATNKSAISSRSDTTPLMIGTAGNPAGGCPLPPPPAP